MRQLVIVAVLIAAMSAFGQDSSSQDTRPDNQDDAVVQTAQTEGQETAEQTLERKTCKPHPGSMLRNRRLNHRSRATPKRHPSQMNRIVLETAQSKEQDGAPEALTGITIVIVQCLWMALIAIGAPLYSKCAAPENNKEELRGLNLPRGSSGGYGPLGSEFLCECVVLGAPYQGIVDRLWLSR